MEPTEKVDKRVDITACLEAVSMYNASYHRERDGIEDVYEKPEYVSVQEHVLAQANKTGASLLSQACIAFMGLALLLIVANVVRNIGEYQAAQPAVNASVTEPTPYGVPIKTEAPEPLRGPITTYPAVVPLPPDWVLINLEIDFALLGLCGLSYLSAIAFKRSSDEIHPGIPIRPANTADLPASDSLVRASEEPRQLQRNVLLRSGAPPLMPEQLLRPAAYGEEKQPEQLVRAVTEPNS